MTADNEYHQPPCELTRLQDRVSDLERVALAAERLERLLAGGYGAEDGATFIQRGVLRRALKQAKQGGERENG